MKQPRVSNNKMNKSKEHKDLKPWVRGVGKLQILHAYIIIAMWINSDLDDDGDNKLQI